MSAQARKLAKNGLYVVTANELLSGDVVFRNANGGWSPGIDAAAVLDSQDKGFVELAEAREDEAANIVIAAALIEVSVEQGAIRPVHIRERIRALGPTVRADLSRTAKGFSVQAIEERS
jgi:hypothetical protein